MVFHGCKIAFHGSFSVFMVPRLVFMVFHGFKLFFCISRWIILVFRGSRPVFMVFHGSRLVFHSSRLVSNGSRWVLMVYMIPGWFFIVSFLNPLAPGSTYLSFGEPD